MFNLRKASLAAMASAALLAGCSSVPVPEEAGMASGASVVTPKQQEYLAAFNAPRGPVYRATVTNCAPSLNGRSLRRMGLWSSRGAQFPTDLTAAPAPTSNWL